MVYSLSNNAEGYPLFCNTGEALEYAVLLSLKARDEAALERSFIQLKTYYVDTKWVHCVMGSLLGAACAQLSGRSCQLPCIWVEKGGGEGGGGGVCRWLAPDAS